MFVSLSGMCMYVCDFAVDIIFMLDTLTMLCSVYTIQHEFVVWGQVLGNQFCSIIFISVRKGIILPQAWVGKWTIAVFLRTFKWKSILSCV